MSEMLVALSFRGAERLVVVCAGFAALWLGYKLFDKVMEHQGTLEGEFAGGKIKLQQVAPGVFFALFGMVTLTSAIFSPLTTGEPMERAEGVVPAAKAKSNATPSLVWSNGTIIAPEGQKAMNLLMSIASAKLSVDKYAAMLSPNERNSVLSSLTSLLRYRDELIDAAWGPGSREVYYDTWKKIADKKITLEQIDTHERSKFEAIMSVMDPK